MKATVSRGNTLTPKRIGTSERRCHHCRKINAWTLGSYKPCGSNRLYPWFCQSDIEMFKIKEMPLYFMALTGKCRAHRTVPWWFPVVPMFHPNRIYLKSWWRISYWIPGTWKKRHPPGSYCRLPSRWIGTHTPIHRSGTGAHPGCLWICIYCAKATLVNLKGSDDAKLGYYKALEASHQKRPEDFQMLVAEAERYSLVHHLSILGECQWIPTK